MSERRVSYGNIEIRAKGSFITLTFDCDFGPIAFSFNPDKFSSRLSMIVSQMLDRIHEDDPETLNAIAKNTQLSVIEVRRILESYILKSHRTVPPSALEKFMQGRNVTLEGAVQQMIEHVPPSIVLMLTHLTTAILLTTTEVTNEGNTKTLLIDRELSQLLDTKFKDSINRLWEKSYENKE